MQRFTLLVALTLATMHLIAHSTVSVSAAGDNGESEACLESMPKKGGSALLQMKARAHKASPQQMLSIVGRSDTDKTVVNPSGAAAPLDEVGYSAVADRCCQAEMKQFIQRTAYQLGYEACIHGGLTGMVRYHSCENGVQSFAKLQADILNNAGDRCTWLGVIGKCLPRPEDCEDFANIPDAPDCGCSRDNAAKIEFNPATSATSVTQNNLGGQGPATGPEEIRYSSLGTTKSGVVFDVVITTLGPYVRIQKPHLNGVSPGGAFGAINIAPSDGADYPGAADFKFSFMSPGTNTPVVVEEVHMALFDLDKEGGSSNVAEFTSSKGYKGYVTDVSPSVAATRLDDGRTKFVAVIKELANPLTPTSLTTAQRQNSVMYFYQQVSSFELSFGTEGDVAKAGRNLFFAFESSLNDRCGP